MTVCGLFPCQMLRLRARGMEGLKLGQHLVHCDDLMRVATFWSAALDRPLDGSHRSTAQRDPEGNEFCIADKSFTSLS